MICLLCNKERKKYHTCVVDGDHLCYKCLSNIIDTVLYYSNKYDVLENAGLDDEPIYYNIGDVLKNILLKTKPNDDIINVNISYDPFRPPQP